MNRSISFGVKGVRHLRLFFFFFFFSFFFLHFFHMLPPSVFKKAAVAALAGAAVGVRASGQECHALALSGGGDRGAFEAGVIAGLVDCLPAGQAEWSVVTGISAGAINAAGFCQYPRGQEKAGAEFLLKSWLEIKAGDIWRNWVPGGLAEGFFVMSGVLDTAPERKTIERLLNTTALADSDRHLVTGATRLEDGKFVLYSNHGMNSSISAIDAVMASSAIPGIFPRVKVDGHSYIDGGTSYMTPVMDSVARCRELFPGIQNHEITVDVVIVSEDPRFGKPVDGIIITPFVLIRTLNDIIKRTFLKDVQNALLSFPGLRVNVVEPSRTLPGYLLGFDHSEEMIGIGYADAQANCTR
jgi:predicted acylesterase/phospholipase RssA